MKRAILTLTILAFLSTPSWAAGGRRYHQVYGGHGHLVPGFGSVWVPSRGESSHDAAVRRIKATHSRYRFKSHPRSLYNGQPHPYDFIGWMR